MVPMVEHGHGKISEMDQADVLLEAAEPGVIKRRESPDDGGSKESGLTVTLKGEFRRSGDTADQPIVIDGVNHTDTRFHQPDDTADQPIFIDEVNDTDARFRQPGDTVDRPIIIDGVNDTKARNLDRKTDDTLPDNSG